MIPAENKRRGTTSAYSSKGKGSLAGKKVKKKKGKGTDLLSSRRARSKESRGKKRKNTQGGDEAQFMTGGY